jgi:hypothetical protein
LTLLDVVIAQSVVRRRIAILEFIRRRDARDNRAVKTIQTKWRGTIACMAYQLILMDVVISQNVVRCKLARIELYRRREARDNRAAKLIQTRWRSAYARMTYQLIGVTLSCLRVWYDAGWHCSSLMDIAWSGTTRRQN